MVNADYTNWNYPNPSMERAPKYLTDPHRSHKSRKKLRSLRHNSRLRGKPHESADYRAISDRHHFTVIPDSSDLQVIFPDKSIATGHDRIASNNAEDVSTSISDVPDNSNFYKHPQHYARDIFYKENSLHSTRPWKNAHNISIGEGISQNNKTPTLEDDASLHQTETVSAPIARATKREDSSKSPFGPLALSLKTAENLYPEEQDNLGDSEASGGWYSIYASVELTDEALQEEEQLLECEVLLPGTPYLSRRNVLYFPGKDYSPFY